MKCIIEKNIAGNCIEVFENDGHFEIYKNNYFDCSCDNMQEVTNELLELITYIILGELRN